MAQAGAWRPRVPATWADRRSAGPLVFLAVGLVYLSLTRFVLWLDQSDDAAAGLWPAAGLTVGALLLLPTRLWGWVLGAVLAAETAGDLATGSSLASALGWSLGNMVEPLVGAGLIRRAGNPHGSLTRLRELLQFLCLAVLAGPLVGGTIGAVTTALGTGVPFREVWPQYVAGDALGVLVVAPVLLAWSAPYPHRSRWESAALWTGAVGTTLVLFSDLGGVWTVTMAYLLIPFLTWAALRYGVLMVAELSVVTVVVANSSTAYGGGAFADAVPGHHAVVLLQCFFGVAVSSALILAVLVGDLSDRRQVERVLRHRATHDLLTGLPNRAVLADELKAALGGAGLSGRGEDGPVVALLVCDIDHFKTVNDTHGHAAGDAFLVEVADRLQTSVRDGDLVARISGDEFVVLVRVVDEASVGTVCDRIMAAVGGRPVAVPTGTSWREVVPSLSVGVALSGAGATAESLFQGADAALYEAKKLGRGRVVHADDGLRARVRDRADVERGLAAALTGDEIHVLHRPVLELATGKVVGFESAARWEHPVRGLLDLDQLVPTVEAAGRTGELFAAVLAQALHAQRRWDRLLGFAPAVSLRLPDAQLADPSLPETLALALTRADAHAGGLWLEVSESATLDGLVLATLATLRDLGVHLSVEGFGTGRSSVSRVAAHPWDLLRIDRVFVDRLTVDPNGPRLVDALVTMAHTLGLPTVADGVETPAQLERLAGLGCDLVGGPVLGAPVTASRAAALVGADGRWAGGPLPVSLPADHRRGAADSSP